MDLKQVLSCASRYAITENPSDLISALDACNWNLGNVIDEIIKCFFEPKVLILFGWICSTDRHKLSPELFGITTYSRFRISRTVRNDLPSKFGYKSVTWGFKMEVFAGFSGSEDEVIEQEVEKRPISDFFNETQERFNDNKPHYEKILRKQLIKTVTFGDLDYIFLEIRKPQIINRKFSTHNVWGSLIPLIESTCDYPLALALSRKLRGSSSISEIDLVKLALIGSQNTASISESLCEFPAGWTRHKVQHPDWKLIDQGPIPHQEVPSLRVHPFGSRNDGTAMHVEAPQTMYTVVSNATIFRGGTILQGGNLLENDLAQRAAIGLVAGRWDYVVGSSASLNDVALKLPESTAQFIPRGIHLASRADFNWFHWLIETMPRLGLVDHLVDSEIPVIISDRLSDAAVEALQIYTDRPIVKINSESLVEIGELVLPGPVIFHPDISHTGWKYGCKLNFDVIDSVREKILSLVPNTSSPTKVFWTRSGGVRGMLNQESILSLALDKGFTLIDPTSLNFAEQVNIFRNATHIATPGGAAMANFMFMQPGSKITSFASEYAYDFLMPSVIAGHFKLQYEVFRGKAVGVKATDKPMDKLHRDYKAPVTKLKNRWIA